MMDIVLLSPVSPFAPPDGHRMAVLSDVEAILDNRLALGVICFRYGNEQDCRPPLCPVENLPAAPGSEPVRLLRGLAKRLPPSAERLYGAGHRRAIVSALRRWAPRVVILDDASVSGYLPLVREHLPNAQVVLRSHNVMHDVRQEQLLRTRGPLAPLVRFDAAAYLRFERTAAECCDAHWAITPSDAARMRALYGRPVDCLSVSIPLDRYAALPADEGRSNGFVHVGTLDFRRRSDLGRFLAVSWPKVLAADPAAALTFAGSLKGNPIPAPNVTYAGRVANDVEAYRRGRFAVNFQSTTGGVKLKTLTSLAAGRTLVSTPAGVEGLPLVTRQHYCDVDEFLAEPDLKRILRDVRATQPVADAGRQYVSEHHSRAALARDFRRLFEALSGVTASSAAPEILDFNFVTRGDD